MTYYSFTVTLGDEEARRRGTQKTVLERRAPPTFDVLIEIQTRDRLVVHEDVAGAVDAMLREKPLPVELRARNEAGEIVIESLQPEIRSIAERNVRDRNSGSGEMERNGRHDRNGRNANRGRNESDAPRFDIGLDATG